MPVYHDFDAARALKLGACLDKPGPDGSVVVEGWHERLGALKTWRYPLMQGGISLVLATVTILLIIKFFRGQDGKRVQTPWRVWHFFALGTAVVVLSWASQVHSLFLDAGRGNFPWCADTLVIPLYSFSVFYLILLPVLMIVGFILSRSFGDLPSDLFIWRKDCLPRSIALSVIFGAFASFLAFLGIDGAVRSAFIGTPAAITAIYLTLSTRAALLAPSVRTI